MLVLFPRGAAYGMFARNAHVACVTRANRRLSMPSIAVVLPMREQVTSGRAGAVALTVSEFGTASRLRDCLLVVGATAPGDFALPYRQVTPGSLAFWRRASDRYARSVADTIAAAGCRIVEVHNRARLLHHLARQVGPPARICLHLHNDPQGMEGLRTSAERAKLLEHATLVYCVSEFVRTRFIDAVQGPLERVVVLHNGIAPIPTMRPERQRTILYVGRLIPEKGVEPLFDALRRIARALPEWRVKIIGRAPQRHRSRYAQIITELRSTWHGRLEHIELLPHADVMQAYASAAITIAPSLWQEPFGRTALEAMAAGSAVIASRSGGLPEVVGQAGLLLDAVTPDSIAEAILALAGDPLRREVLGRAGEQRAASVFAIELLSRQLDARRAALLRQIGQCPADHEKQRDG